MLALRLIATLLKFPISERLPPFRVMEGEVPEKVTAPVAGSRLNRR